MDLKQIELKPLESISPSQFSRLKKCSYNSILSKAFSHPLLPYTPTVHLGTIVHKCIRKIFAGEIDTEEVFEKAWNALEKEEENKLSDYGFSFFLPLKENVLGYTIKKLQVRAIFREQLNKSERENDGEKDIQFMNEKWLQSKDSKIAGSVDHILKIDDFVKLTDTKTGEIINESGEVKESYEEQLKLYAYLYCEEFDQYPNELVIRDLKHNEIVIPFTEDECDALAKSAKNKLESINESLVKDDLENLANPAIEICSKCLFRPACKYHWSIKSDNSIDTFTDVKGILQSLNQYKNGNINVTISNNGSELIVTQLENESMELLQSLEGKEVGIYNVIRSNSDGIYKSTKWTTIYAV